MNPDDLSRRLAETVRAARLLQRMSVMDLAEQSGVSRAMVGKIERGEVQPTAALLARLSGALGLTLSELVARAENASGLLIRAADQPVFIDPDTGYRRRAISPPSASPLELVEIVLPAGARVPMPAASYTFIHQQLWVLSGTLRFREGATEHVLHRGDCLQLGPPVPCEFINDTQRDCRYLVALSKRRAHDEFRGGQ